MVRTLLFVMFTGLFVMSGCGCEKMKESEAGQEQKTGEETKAPEGSVINLTTNETFAKDVLESTKPVVVDFSAHWCGACRELGPTLEEVAKEMPEYAFYKVDIDADKDLAQKYNISGVPTLVFVKDGKEVDVTKRHIGTASKDHLKTAITEAFGAVEPKQDEAKPEEK